MAAPKSNELKDKSFHTQSNSPERSSLTSSFSSSSSLSASSSSFFSQTNSTSLSIASPSTSTSRTFSQFIPPVTIRKPTSDLLSQFQDLIPYFSWNLKSPTKKEIQINSISVTATIPKGEFADAFLMELKKVIEKISSINYQISQGDDDIKLTINSINKKSLAELQAYQARFETLVARVPNNQSVF